MTAYKKVTEGPELRRRAEKKLNAQTVESSPEDPRRLLHELQVHQIELEMQNEELQSCRIELERVSERYSELYDFAPVGYFTLLPDGAISQANLAGARLLGVERTRLVGRRLRSFVGETNAPAFDSFMVQLFSARTHSVCVVQLPQGQSPKRTVLLEAALSSDGREGLAAVVDITDHWKADGAAGAVPLTRRM